MPYKYSNDFGFHVVWWLNKLRDSICFVHGMMEMHGKIIHLSSYIKCPLCLILTKIKWLQFLINITLSAFKRICSGVLKLCMYTDSESNLQNTP
jgi:hypothetical protein